MASVSLFDSMLNVLENRDEYISPRELLVVLKYRCKSDDIEMCIFEMFKVLDDFFFVGTFTQALSMYKIRVLYRPDGTENIVTVKSSLSKSCINILIHQPLDDPELLEVDNVDCTLSTCFFLILLHEMVHILEFLVRVELQTRYGYTSDERLNVLFQTWKKCLFFY